MFPSMTLLLCFSRGLSSLAPWIDGQWLTSQLVATAKILSMTSSSVGGMKVHQMHFHSIFYFGFAESRTTFFRV
jgi:hypothetical protein